MLDLLIKNAVICDGSAKNPFIGSVGISGDTVKNIFSAGTVLPEAAFTIEAEGYVCTPGFIDIHRHADYAVFSDDFGTCELAQGLTTVINGNCGMSGAPVQTLSSSESYLYQKPVIGAATGTAQTGCVKEYFTSLKKKAPVINAGMLVGLGTIAGEINGLCSPLEKANIPKIQNAVSRAIEEGAVGVSLGIGYKPVFSYSKEEIISCLEPLRSSDIPITVHMRQEGDGMLEALEECISIARELNVFLEISHLKAIGVKNWHIVMPKALRMLNAAREEGVRLGWDVYPYTAGSTQLTHVLPPDILGREGEILADPILYKDLEKRIAEGTDFENIIRLCGYENIFPGTLRSEKFQEYNGLSLAQGAEKARTEPLRWLLTVLSEEAAAPSMIDFITCEEDINLALSDNNTSVISDSIYPEDKNFHPRVAGTFSRVIEKFVCRDKLLSLQEAVRRMTSLPAERLGIKDRGRLLENHKADLCIFNPALIKENASYTLPLASSLGMEYTVVNGKIAFEHGHVANKHAGQCVK